MERDFQDGATGINKIAFCNFCDEKEARKGGGIKGVYTIPLPSPPPPVLPSSFFIFQSPKVFYFWLIVIVIIIIIEYYATCLKVHGSLQLIVTRLRQKCSQTMMKKKKELKPFSDR